MKDAYRKHYEQLLGKTVDAVVVDDSDKDIGPCYGLLFTDGTVAWIMRDEEGNGPGFLEI